MLLPDSTPIAEIEPPAPPPPAPHDPARVRGYMEELAQKLGLSASEADHLAPEQPQ